MPRVNYATVFGFYDSSVREQDLYCRKCGMPVTWDRLGDLAGVTRARQRQFFERMRILCFDKNWYSAHP